MTRLTTLTSLHIDVPGKPLLQSYGWYVDTIPSIGHRYETIILFDDLKLTIRGTIKDISWSVIANDDMRNGTMQHVTLHFHKDLFVLDESISD